MICRYGLVTLNRDSLVDAIKFYRMLSLIYLTPTFIEKLSRMSGRMDSTTVVIVGITTPSAVDTITIQENEV